MTAERELVALLYRADWTRLSLSGVVRSELRDVASGESDDFGFEPPAGLRGVDEP